MKDDAESGDGKRPGDKNLRRLIGRVVGFFFSVDRRVYIVAAVAYAVLIFYIIATPSPPSPPGEQAIPNLDKIIHGGMFFVLGALAAMSRWKKPVLPISLAAIYGVFCEAYQLSVPARSFSFPDMGANIAGVLLGGVLVVSFKKLFVELLQQR